MKTPLLLTGRPARVLLKSAVAVGALALAATTSHSQTRDTRWQAFTGCWTPAVLGVTNGPITNDAGLLCIIPESGSDAVNVVTIANSRVAHIERLLPNDAHISKTLDNCPGWESSAFSADGHRLLLRSEFVCGSNAVVKGSGIFGISSEGDLVQVQGTTVGTNANARAVRYHAANVMITTASGGAFADSATVLMKPVAESFGINAARLMAGYPANTNTIIEVAKRVETPVAEAWLNELGQRFSVNAKELVKLADGGVPPRMLDLMVALSYPDRYSVVRNDGTKVGGGNGGDIRQTRNADYSTMRAVSDREAWDCGYSGRILTYGYYGNSCLPGYYYYGSDYYRYGSYGGLNYYPYGGGYGYYGSTPVVIIGNSSNSSPETRGKAVRGSGYTQGGSSTSSTPRSDKAQSPSTSSGSSSSGSSSSGSSSSGSSSAGSSSAGEARTAKPRTPPPM